MQSIFIIVAVALFLVLLWLVWNNRGSEKIMAALVSSMIAVVVSILLTIVFTKPAPKRLLIPVSVPVRTADWSYVPLKLRSVNSIWNSWMFDFGNIRLREVIQKKEFRNIMDVEVARALYQQLLQRLVLEWLANIYGRSWTVRRETFELPIATQSQMWPPEPPEGNSEVVKIETLRDLLTDNLFADTQIFPFVKAMHLPPGTHLTAGSEIAGNSKVYVIRLDNRLVDITIKITSITYVWSIGEYYEIEEWWNKRAGQPLTWLEPDNPSAGAARPYASLVYHFEAQLHSSRWKNGHPEMKRNLAWAEHLLELLIEYSLVFASL